MKLGGTRGEQQGLLEVAIVSRDGGTAASSRCARRRRPPASSQSRGGLGRLRFLGEDHANDYADKQTYESGEDAVDGPSHSPTDHAEDDPENLGLLVTALIRVAV